MKIQNTAKPIDEMSETELQTARDAVMAQIESDEREYSSLTPRMVEAAEQGLTDEWTRLHALHATLPTKVTGMRLRLSSISILLKAAGVEKAEADVTQTGIPLQGLQAKFDQAKKELDAATHAYQDAYHHANDNRRDLAALRNNHADLQAAARGKK